jgi:hypothetical protein
MTLKNTENFGKGNAPNRSISQDLAQNDKLQNLNGQKYYS